MAQLAGYKTLDKRHLRRKKAMNKENSSSYYWINGSGAIRRKALKTVIASKAFAKISMRLVPDRDWEHITDVHQSFHQHCP
jgi:acetylornithine deacetylase/succinyl-diaminopimelate desuccinylase-like protein